MDNKKTAFELVKKYGKHLALEHVNEIIANHPHQIIKEYYVDSSGNKTDESYFKLVPNELYWRSIKNEIELI